MKKSHFLLLVAAALLIVSFSECKDKSAEPKYYLTARIGNENVSFEDELMTATNFGTSKDAFIFSVYPEDTKHGFMLTTATPVTGAPATLRIDYTSVQTQAGESLYGTTGTCSISKLDGKTVEGTFSFDDYTDQGALVQVREGRFRLKFS